MEPDGDVEIQSYPVLKKLSVKLTDCKVWLEGRDFLSLGKKSELNLEKTYKDSFTSTGSLT